MNSQFVTGIALIVVPIFFNVCFAALAKQFDYPEVLRQPTPVVLNKFQEGGTKLVLTWWMFMLSAVLFAPVSIATAAVMDTRLGVLGIVSIGFGLLSSLVQFLGLARWPFVVPYLARESATASVTKSESVDLIFQVLNRYLGVGVGEHLGYFFTGAWTVSVSTLMLRQTNVTVSIGMFGIAVGLILILCSFEFVGSNEEFGWKVAAFLTPITYVLWSLWLIVVGIIFLIGFD